MKAEKQWCNIRCNGVTYEAVISVGSLWFNFFQSTLFFSLDCYGEGGGEGGALI